MSYKYGVIFGTDDDSGNDSNDGGGEDGCNGDECGSGSDWSEVSDPLYVDQYVKISNVSFENVVVIKSVIYSTERSFAFEAEDITLKD